MRPKGFEKTLAVDQERMGDAGKQPLAPARPGMQQLARKPNAVLQNALRMGAQFRARKTGGIGGADDGADRGAGDRDRTHAEFVERLQAR